MYWIFSSCQFRSFRKNVENRCRPKCEVILRYGSSSSVWYSRWKWFYDIGERWIEGDGDRLLAWGYLGTLAGPWVGRTCHVRYGTTFGTDALRLRGHIVRHVRPRYGPKSGKKSRKPAVRTLRVTNT